MVQRDHQDFMITDVNLTTHFHMWGVGLIVCEILSKMR